MKIICLGFFITIFLGISGCRVSSEEVFKAMKKGNDQVVKKYILSNQNINIQNKQGQTLLMLAIYHKKKEIIDLILQKKPNPNVIDKDGWSTLTWCVLNNDFITLEKIMPYVKNVHQIDIYSYTPLIWATHKDYYEIVRVLLSHPTIKINYETKQGYTSLNQSVVGGNIKIIELLIKGGADINFINNQNMTALDYAFKELKSERNDLNENEKKSYLSRRTKIIDFLKKHGAKTSVELKTK
jgi:ankyrin repeat protein